VASDGTQSAEELIGRAVEAGIRALSVTDHDTMQSVPAAARAAETHGLAFVPGIEITAVWQGRDVHVLGYFLDPGDATLLEFLAAQQHERIERAREIARRLEIMGVPIDIEAIISRRGGGPRSIARPILAEALVAAGHARSIADAFDRFLGEERGAFVPHQGRSPAAVVELIGSLHGIASLAHPGVWNRDDMIPALVDAGLAGLEVYHPEHDAMAQARYLKAAGTYGLLTTGGSDYHGEGKRRAEWLGRVGVPAEAFKGLCQKAGWPNTKKSPAAS
jgi:predicted metal-dependent phosphoesterase TrpH